MSTKLVRNLYTLNQKFCLTNFCFISELTKVINNSRWSVLSKPVSKLPSAAIKDPLYWYIIDEICSCTLKFLDDTTDVVLISDEIVVYDRWTGSGDFNQLI